MYYEKDGKEMVLNVTNWLREMYGDEIKSEIQIVELHQTEDAVWVTVKREQDRDLGTLVTYESFDMEIVRDPIEEEEILCYPPDTDIETNARNLFVDKETLMNVTSIFD